MIPTFLEKIKKKEFRCASCNAPLRKKDAEWDVLHEAWTIPCRTCMGINHTYVKLKHFTEVEE